MDMRERFLGHVEIDEWSGCWEWTGYKSSKGYGQFQVSRGISRRAHRVAWGLWRGDIPEGLQVDHLCRNRACVNPDHLEPVTCRENLLRGQTLAAMNAAKTHCMRGHEFTAQNTRLYAGRRWCRQCANGRRARKLGG